jgi:hypothetical protein
MKSWFGLSLPTFPGQARTKKFLLAGRDGSPEHKGVRIAMTVAAVVTGTGSVGVAIRKAVAAAMVTATEGPEARVVRVGTAKEGVSCPV